MPWIDYRELRHRLDVQEVLAWMDWHATEVRSHYLRGRCPLCGLAQPSGTQRSGTVQTRNGREFSVHRHRKLFRCFRCKAGGNMLDLWSRYYKIDLATAAHELTKHLRNQPNATSSNSPLHPDQPSI